MSPHRRLTVIAAAVVALFSGSAAAAVALPSNHLPSTREVTGNGENEHGDWWCVAIEETDLGYCQTDPLPERLPLPYDRPSL